MGMSGLLALGLVIVMWVILLAVAFFQSSYDPDVLPIVLKLLFVTFAVFGIVVLWERYA